MGEEEWPLSIRNADPYHLAGSIRGYWARHTQSALQIRQPASQSRAYL